MSLTVKAVTRFEEQYFYSSHAVQSKGKEYNWTYSEHIKYCIMIDRRNSFFERIKKKYACVML